MKKIFMGVVIAVAGLMCSCQQQNQQSSETQGAELEHWNVVKDSISDSFFDSARHSDMNFPRTTDSVSFQKLSIEFFLTTGQQFNVVVVRKGYSLFP